MVATYKSGDEVEGFAKWVSDEVIAAHQHSLVVRRFVGGVAATNGNVLELEDAIAAYRDARAQRERAEVLLDEVLASLEDGGE